MSDLKETPRLRVTGLKKSFGNNVILHNVSFELAKASSLVIIGGSGSGKSVLIKCISGLYPLDQGQIEVNGRVLTSRQIILVQCGEKILVLCFKMQRYLTPLIS